MERLGDIVARVLAGVRDTMDGKPGGAQNLPGKVAEVWGGDCAPRLAEVERHPRSSSRRMAKKATGLDAKISMKR